MSVSDTPRNRGNADAPHMSPVTPAEDVRSIAINDISWGAVLAGVVVALVAQLILNMIGIGVGASTLDPGAGPNENPSAQGFSIGAGIWWTVSGIVASLAGGYVAGRLSGKPKPSTTSWHGLIAWALTTLVVFYLLTSAIGGLVGGAYRGLTSAVGGAASTAGGAIQTAAQTAAPALASGVADPFSSIEQSLRGVTGGNDPAAMRDAAVAAVRAAVTGNNSKRRMHAIGPRTLSQKPRTFRSSKPGPRSSNMSSSTARVSRRPNAKRPKPRQLLRGRCRVELCLVLSLFCSVRSRVGSADVWEQLNPP